MAQEKKCFRQLTLAEQKERGAIIREGGTNYTSSDYENYARFSGMTAETGRKLIEAGFADPNDQQNDSPTFLEMVEFCEGHPGFTMHGYTIGEDRSDARITVEGIQGEAASIDDALDFAEAFRYADDMSIARGTDHPSCYCWYD